MMMMRNPLAVRGEGARGLRKRGGRRGSSLGGRNPDRRQRVRKHYQRWWGECPELKTPTMTDADAAKSSKTRSRRGPGDKGSIKYMIPKQNIYDRVIEFNDIDWYSNKTRYFFSHTHLMVCHTSGTNIKRSCLQLSLHGSRWVSLVMVYLVLLVDGVGEVVVQGLVYLLMGRIPSHAFIRTLTGLLSWRVPFRSRRLWNALILLSNFHANI